MKYCNKCGKELIDEAYVCTGCGVRQTPLSAPRDKGGIGWGLLGFFVPIAGLILYLLWQGTHPKNAKAAGKGALVYLIFMILFFIAYIAFIVWAIIYSVL